LIEDRDSRRCDVHRNQNSGEGMRSEESGQHQNQRHCELVFHLLVFSPSSLFVMRPDSRLMGICFLTLRGSERIGFMPHLSLVQYLPPKP
jgi:hypothetical protein